MNLTDLLPSRQEAESQDGEPGRPELLEGLTDREFRVMKVLENRGDSDLVGLASAALLSTSETQDSLAVLSQAGLIEYVDQPDGPSHVALNSKTLHQAIS